MGKVIPTREVKFTKQLMHVLNTQLVLLSSLLTPSFPLQPQTISSHYASGCLSQRGILSFPVSTFQPQASCPDSQSRLLTGLPASMLAPFRHLLHTPTTVTP